MGPSAVPWVSVTSGFLGVKEEFIMWKRGVLEPSRMREML